jgi:hypothetical protein
MTSTVKASTAVRRSKPREAAHSALLGIHHNALGSDGTSPNLPMLGVSDIRDTSFGNATAPTKLGLRESDSARTAATEAGTFPRRFD